MSDQAALRRAKHDIITEILKEENLYAILGTSKSASATELRRCYLQRSKIIHPDRGPSHPQSTSAFQRLGFAFEILKSPTARRTYDQASTSRTKLPDKTNFLGGEHTFRGAVEAVFNEFMTGDFLIVRRWLESLHARYPNLVGRDVVVNIEKCFIRIREIVVTTRTYALLIYIELGRINRVSKRLMALPYLDVVGRTRMTIQLVRVTLAIPIRVDRAIKHKEEKAWRARAAGLQAAGVRINEADRDRAGILNDRLSYVLQFLVGKADLDDGADDPWSNRMDDLKT